MNLRKTSTNKNSPITTPSKTPNQQTTQTTPPPSNEAVADPLTSLELAFEQGLSIPDRTLQHQTKTPSARSFRGYEDTSNTVGARPKAPAIKTTQRQKAAAAKSANQAGFGYVSETKKFITLQLSDGKKLHLPKYSEGNTKFPYTSLVDKKGNAFVTGKLSKNIDQSIRSFLKNIDARIQKQTKKVAQLSKRGWLKNEFAITSDGKFTAAKAELKELKRIRQFGIRFFYNIEAINQGKGDGVLARYQGNELEPEQVAQMRKIYMRSNSAVIREVQESPEFYRALGSQSKP